MTSNSTPKISRRALEMPQNAIRHLVPLAEAAERRGVHVHRLNIGQPDIVTPPELSAPLESSLPSVFAYGHSAGDLSLRRALRNDLARVGAQVHEDDILVTHGASEALTFALTALCDAGDEVLTPDPTYANYLGFSASLGVALRPLPTFAEDRWALPSTLDNHINGTTRAILLSNPGNPTGAFYSREVLSALLETARRHDLWLIVDEVYRGLVFGEHPAYSALSLDDPEGRVIVVESTSKRYSTCGLRIGALVTRNPAIQAATMSFAQARLSCSVLSQQMVAQIDTLDEDAREAITNTYRERLALTHELLATIPGVHAPPAEGAFYQMATLPVRDASRFVRFLVEEFSCEGETVLVTPASGFYLDPNRGLDQIRIACVLGLDSLRAALRCLAEGLRAYLVAHPDEGVGTPPRAT